jgi:hypothetical protein
MAMSGRAKARKNLNRSILRASIIIIDGPTFSVLRSIDRKLRENKHTISDMMRVKGMK